MFNILCKDLKFQLSTVTAKICIVPLTALDGSASETEKN